MNFNIAEGWNYHIGNARGKLSLYRSECSRLSSMRIQRENLANAEKSGSNNRNIFSLGHCDEEMDHARRATNVARGYWFKGTQGIVDKFFSIQSNNQT